MAIFFNVLMERTSFISEWTLRYYDIMFQLREQLKNVPPIVYSHRDVKSSILYLQTSDVTLTVTNNPDGLREESDSKEIASELKPHRETDDSESFTDSSSVDKILQNN